jgi:hypothetical protein
MLESAFLTSRLLEQFAMRPEPDKPEQVGGRLGIDQEEIGPEMAIPIARSISGQLMIAIVFRQRAVIDQQLQYGTSRSSSSRYRGMALTLR